jgi:hypothetical protein
MTQGEPVGALAGHDQVPRMSDAKGVSMLFQLYVEFELKFLICTALF